MSDDKQIYINNEDTRIECNTKWIHVISMSLQHYMGTEVVILIPKNIIISIIQNYILMRTLKNPFINLRKIESC